MKSLFGVELFGVSPSESEEEHCVVVLGPRGWRVLVGVDVCTSIRCTSVHDCLTPARSEFLKRFCFGRHLSTLNFPSNNLNRSACAAASASASVFEEEF